VPKNLHKSFNISSLLKTFIRVAH